MTNSKESPYISIRQKEKYIHTSEDFIMTLKICALGLEVTQSSYDTFQTTAVEFMSEVLYVYEHLVSDKTAYNEKKLRDMTRAKDTVQEGLAHLVADKRDGMPYGQFTHELKEWKATWNEQLRPM